MYEDGRGVAKDRSEALRWYAKAAEQGLPMAQEAVLRVSRHPESQPNMDAPSVFLAIGGQRHGPFSMKTVESMYRAGKVAADALYWQHGMSAWKPIDGLFAAAPVKRSEPSGRRRHRS